MTREQSCLLETCPQNSPVVIKSSSPLVQPLIHKGLYAIARPHALVQNLLSKHHPKPTEGPHPGDSQGPWQNTLRVVCWVMLNALACAHQHCITLRKWKSIWCAILSPFLRRQNLKLSRACPMLSYHNDIFILLLLMIFYHLLILYCFWGWFLEANIIQISNLDSCIFQRLSSDKFTPIPSISLPKPGQPRLKCPWYWPAAAKLAFLCIAFLKDTRPSSWELFFCLGYNHEFKKYDSNKGICLLCWSLKEILGVFNNIPISFINYTMLKTRIDQQNVIADIKLKNRYNTGKPLSMMKNSRLQWYLH